MYSGEWFYSYRGLHRDVYFVGRDVALLNTAAVVIQNNLANVLRDEAATLAQAKMSDIKNTPFPDINFPYLSSQPPQPTVLPICGPTGSPVVVTRYVRGVAMNYNVVCDPEPLDSAGDLSVQVIVSWWYKGNLYSALFRQ